VKAIVSLITSSYLADSLYGESNSTFMSKIEELEIEYAVDISIILSKPCKSYGVRDLAKNNSFF